MGPHCLRDDGNGGLASLSGDGDGIGLDCVYMPSHAGMHVEETGMDGCSDSHALVLLNVAGKDCVDDLRILKVDEGFVKVLRRVELHGLRCKERREQEWLPQT